MRDLKEIEDLLRQSRLPDTEAPKSKGAIWHRLIKEQRRRRRLPRLFWFPPWVWALLSLLMLAISVFIMVTTR